MKKINVTQITLEELQKKDKRTFIVNAVNQLDTDISLPSYKLIVYPESMSELNRSMLGYLNMFASPEIVSMELIKSLPSLGKDAYGPLRSW